MAAKDYEFFPAEVSGKVYLAKKTKDPNVMSSDRRIVEDNEILGIFEYFLRRFCKLHGGTTLSVTEGDKTIFEATLKDYTPPLNPNRQKRNGHDLCSACGNEIESLEIQSPMLSDELWLQVLDFYHVPEPDRDKGEHAFICADCMEKALGRKLSPEDLVPVLWNQCYRLHTFYGVDFDTIQQLRREAKHYATEDAPKINKEDFKRYTDFMTGVMAVFENPKLAGIIKAIQNTKPDNQ